MLAIFLKGLKITDFCFFKKEVSRSELVSKRKLGDGVIFQIKVIKLLKGRIFKIRERSNFIAFQIELR